MMSDIQPEPDESALLTDASNSAEGELAFFVNEIIREIDHVLLTVDELATISTDLALPIVLDGGIESDGRQVDHEAARRSLASKGLVLDTEIGTQLAPWLTVMADTASDPLLLVRMRRTSREISFEWTLFVDHLLGVQQQSGADGVVMWAPFPVADVSELIVEALILEPTAVAAPISFKASFETLSRIDSFVGAHRDLVLLDFPGVPEQYLAAVVSPGNTTLNIGVLDRTIEPPALHELSWACLNGEYWEMKPSDAANVYQSTVTITLRSGDDLLRQILTFFPSADEENIATA
jgi:hypothetical protein